MNGFDASDGDLMLEYVLLGVSAISLYLSVFWLNVLHLEKARMMGTKKPRQTIFPTLSLIVPAFNEEQNIAKTLASLLKLDYPKDKLDIIVVDDGSNDHTAKIVRAFKKDGVRLLNKKHSGKGSSLNFGLKAAVGELFGIVDADSTVEPDSLKTLVPHFSDPKVGAVISGIKVANQKKILERLQRFEYLFATLFRRLLTALNTLYITPGVLSLYRRDVVLRLGGFDEKNPTEDLEMALRLHHAFYKVEMELDSVTYTTVPSTIRAFERQRVRWCRGHIHNILGKYRDMFFNKKYGLMGTFQFPLHVLAPAMMIFAVCLVLFSVYLWVASTVWQALFTREALLAFTIPTIKQFFLNINLRVGFSVAVLFLLGLYLYNKAHVFGKKSGTFRELFYSSFSFIRCC